MDAMQMQAMLPVAPHQQNAAMRGGAQLHLPPGQVLNAGLVALLGEELFGALLRGGPVGPNDQMPSVTVNGRFTLDESIRGKQRITSHCEFVEREWVGRIAEKDNFLKMFDLVKDPKRLSALMEYLFVIGMNNGWELTAEDVPGSGSNQASWKMITHTAILSKSITSQAFTLQHDVPRNQMLAKERAHILALADQIALMAVDALVHGNYPSPHLLILGGRGNRPRPIEECPGGTTSLTDVGAYQTAEGGVNVLGLAAASINTTLEECDIWVPPALTARPWTINPESWHHLPDSKANATNGTRRLGYGEESRVFPFHASLGFAGNDPNDPNPPVALEMPDLKRGTNTSVGYMRMLEAGGLFRINAQTGVIEGFLAEVALLIFGDHYDEEDDTVDLAAWYAEEGARMPGARDAAARVPRGGDDDDDDGEEEEEADAPVVRGRQGAMQTHAIMKRARPPIVKTVMGAAHLTCADAFLIKKGTKIGNVRVSPITKTFESGGGGTMQYSQQSRIQVNAAVTNVMGLTRVNNYAVTGYNTGLNFGNDDFVQLSGINNDEDDDEDDDVVMGARCMMDVGCERSPVFVILGRLSTYRNRLRVPNVPDPLDIPTTGILGESLHALNCADFVLNRVRAVNGDAKVSARCAHFKRYRDGTTKWVRGMGAMPSLSPDYIESISRATKFPAAMSSVNSYAMEP